MRKKEIDWSKLSKEAVRILRDKGTEIPFSGKYVNHKENGMYTCAACGSELFLSDTKFDSGTGWPSFFDVKGRVDLKEDTGHGMHRVEVCCGSCGSHLGHVFDDGPHDKRYCINSCALDFSKKLK